MKNTRKCRDTGEPLTAFGYLLDVDGRPIQRYVDLTRQGDYGADPLPDGTFRMVPSGEIVDYAERCRRLSGLSEVQS